MGQFLTLTQKRELVINYIKTNPGCTCKDIQRETKQKVERLFDGLGEAYQNAKIPFPKSLLRRDKTKQKSEVIEYIRNNPFCSILDIHKKVGVNVIRLFGGIIEAYFASGVPYPIKEVATGVRNPEIVRRCNKYEKRIITLLSKYGDVKPKFRNSAGIADCVIDYYGNLFVVEIKDYRGKNNITMSEIKQLMRYMLALDIKYGLLVCPKESFPKRINSRNLYKEGLTIYILSEADLRGRSINLPFKKGTVWLESLAPIMERRATEYCGNDLSYGLLKLNFNEETS